MGRLKPRPAVIPVYAKERLQFLASVKIRIFSGNKSIILTFFTEGKEVIPFEDISGLLRQFDSPDSSDPSRLRKIVAVEEKLSALGQMAPIRHDF